MRSVARASLVIATFASLLSSCSINDNISARAFRRDVKSHVSHIVIIIQENRSFDNLFHDYPGADTADFGYAHDGTRVALQPVSFSAAYDIANGLQAFKLSYDDGRMDGYDLRPILPPGLAKVPIAAAQYPAFAYVPRSEAQPYFEMASQYVLADRMFQSNVDQSFAAHLLLIAGQANHTVNVPDGFPWGCDAPSRVSIPTITRDRTLGHRLFPCFDTKTLADELVTKGLNWRYYAPAITFGKAGPSTSRQYSSLPGGSYEAYSKALSPTAPRSPRSNVGQVWSAFDAIAHTRYGPAWRSSVISPSSQFIRDVAEGQLASVTWIVPDWANSDHPLSRQTTGPSWVAALVNAVGKSKFWPDTTVLVTWDDSGGWFDHVPPPQFDSDGLGIRVPLLVVSPFAKRGFVSHKQFEFGSILRLAEAAFDVPPLAASDSRASDLADCFDFSQSPRSFNPFVAPYGPEYFIHARASVQPPYDD